MDTTRNAATPPNPAVVLQLALQLQLPLLVLSSAAAAAAALALLLLCHQPETNSQTSFSKPTRNSKTPLPLLLLLVRLNLLVLFPGAPPLASAGVGGYNFSNGYITWILDGFSDDFCKQLCGNHRVIQGNHEENACITALFIHFMQWSPLYPDMLDKSPPKVR